jgi:hypothetical protein
LLASRPTEGCATASSDFREPGIRRAIAARSPAVILLDECALVSQQETRDFGKVLRHELNNPLTGILG